MRYPVPFRIKKQISAIQKELKVANSELSTTINTYNKLFEQLKEKYEKELDSAYYLEKKFVFDSRADDKAYLGDQAIMSTFFYVEKKDVVKLFIWPSGSSGVTTAMEISINGGAYKKPQDFDAPSWTDVDITALVEESSVLNGYQYPGIGARVYNIEIKPTISFHKRIISTSVTKSQQKGEMAKFNEHKEIVIHALVIVRRSPFK